MIGDLKFDYKVVERYINEAFNGNVPEEVFLQKLGEEGWELILLLTSKQGYYVEKLKYYFKKVNLERSIIIN